MKLANAFAAAWKDFKGAAVHVSTFLAKNNTEIEKVVAEGSAVAVAAGAPPAVVSEFDTLEEAVMGKLIAASQDVTNASALSQVLGDAVPSIEALAATLKNHPTVVSVTAALAPKAA